MNNNTRTRIKTVITAESQTLKNIVDELNIRHPSKSKTAQNLSNKLSRKTIRFDEVAEIMDILGYDIVLRNRKTGKEF